MFTYAPVNHCGIYNAGIWSYFYIQTAEMELPRLEEMAASEKTGFRGFFGAQSTDRQRAGCGRILSRQYNGCLGTIGSHGLMEESFNGRHGGGRK